MQNLVTDNEISWKTTYDEAPVAKYIDQGTFLKKVHIASGLGMLGIIVFSSLIGCYLMAHPRADIIVLLAIITGFLLTAITSGYICSTNITMNIKIDSTGHKGTIATEQSLTREIMYGLFIFAQSLMISPLVGYHILSGNETSVALAAMLTTFITIGTTLYVTKIKSSNIGTLGNTLFSTLFCFIIMGLLSITLYPIYPEFMTIWHTVDTYLGLLLFIIIDAYDTYKAIEMHANMNPDYIRCAVERCQTAANIFIRLLEIIPKKKD